MKKILLVFIILVAAIVRLSYLSTFPSGLNADEAALGYNAYSLMLTGKDEHGHAWPVNLESFGDFKPALYSYLLIPFIKIFGLSEIAVRLPSALFGIAAIALMYLLARELVKDESTALIAAGILAISPWHIHFSRGGWEVNVSTTLIMFAVWSVLKWAKNNKGLYLGFSVLGFVLSMYTYQSARIIAPVLAVSLFLFFRSLWKGNIKEMTKAAIFGLVLLTPLIISILATNAVSRFSGVGFLSDQGPLNRVNELRGQHHDPNSVLSKVLHNRPVGYTLQFIENYTDHFSGDFLFVSGDAIQRNKIPEMGLLYITDFLFLALGAVVLLRSKHTNATIIWIWLLIAPLAAALTFQTPHALRAQMMIIPLTIIIALGISTLTRKINILLLLLLLLPIYTWQFGRYLHEYYVHYPKTYPAAWEYGFKEAVAYAESVKNNYDQILVTDKYDQPYILFLFYSMFPPTSFQNHHGLTVRDEFNFSTVRSYDKYRFENTAWDNVRDIHTALIIAAPEDIPEVGVNIVKTIYFPGGAPAFKIISN